MLLLLITAIVLMPAVSADAGPMQVSAQAPEKSPAAASSTQAARQRSTAQSPRASALTGRVIDEGGQPVEDASVIVTPAGLMNNQNPLAAFRTRPTSTDENGNFSLDDIASGAYTVIAIAPGYAAVGGYPEDGGVRKYYRPGDSVTIRMTKGGVITGTVTASSGEPVVAARVRAIRIRDGEGRTVRGTSLNPVAFMRDWKTDDRGVYRLYGLEPGSYVVSAGGKGLIPSQTGAYDGDAPTYFPSSTRDTAAEVKVAAGQEATGIDIRYRDTPGHAISGSVTGALPSSMQSAIIITLTQASTGSPEAATFLPTAMPNRSFSFDGLHDGEYYVAAASGGATESAAASIPRHVIIKNNDVTGMELSLVPLGSISGRVVVHALQAEPNPDCQPARKMSMEEIVILPRRDAKAGDQTHNPERNWLLNLLPFGRDGTPTVKGDFVIPGLEAARYRIEPQLPGESFYVRSITLPPAVPGGQPVDATNNGISIKSGERIADLTVTLSEGAASLGGKVIAATEGAAFPPRLRVHLVPAEREKADDALRFAEAFVQSDGTFTLGNIAPGRYLLLARPLAESEMSERVVLPAAWEKGGRARLRAEAEAINTSIELQRCQRVTDYKLRYRPPAAGPKPKSE